MTKCFVLIGLIFIFWGIIVHVIPFKETESLKKSERVFDKSKILKTGDE